MFEELVKAAPHALTYVINNWTTIGAYTIGGTSVATVVHKVESTRGYKDFQKYGLALLGLLSAAVVLGNYIIQAHVQNPDVLPKNFAFLLTAAIFLHKFAVSPLGAKITSVKANSSTLSAFKTAVADYKQLKATAKTATEAPAQPPAEFSL